MLLGENGRSSLGYGDRPMMRASFMRGMKRAIRKYVSVTGSEEIQAVIKVGSSASTFAQDMDDCFGHNREESDNGDSDSEDERDY